jgi:hypothetical protein
MKSPWRDMCICVAWEQLGIDHPISCHLETWAIELFCDVGCVGVRHGGELFSVRSFVHSLVRWGCLLATARRTFDVTDVLDGVS